jgi:hypothetical protein
MIIILDTTTSPDIPHIIFSLERKDFVESVGHKFIRELKYDLQGQYFLTTEFKGVLIWLMDVEHIDIFINCYKKYFPSQFANQKVKVI